MHREGGGGGDELLTGWPCSVVTRDFWLYLPNFLRLRGFVRLGLVFPSGSGSGVPWSVVELTCWQCWDRTRGLAHATQRGHLDVSKDHVPGCFQRSPRYPVGSEQPLPVGTPARWLLTRISPEVLRACPPCAVPADLCWGGAVQRFCHKGGSSGDCFVLPGLFSRA